LEGGLESTLKGNKMLRKHYYVHQLETRTPLFVLVALNPAVLLLEALQFIEVSSICTEHGN
jgi:hypothetical protein